MSDFKIVKDRLNKIPEETKVFVALSFDILERIHEIMEMKGISYKDLALSLNKSQPEISKWINGSQNFTIKTLAKLQVALGEEIINVPCRRNKLYDLEKVQEVPVRAWHVKPERKVFYSIKSEQDCNFAVISEKIASYGKKKENEKSEVKGDIWEELISESIITTSQLMEEIKTKLHEAV